MVFVGYPLRAWQMEGTSAQFFSVNPSLHPGTTQKGNMKNTASTYRRIQRQRWAHGHIDKRWYPRHKAWRHSSGILKLTSEVLVPGIQTLSVNVAVCVCCVSPGKVCHMKHARSVSCHQLATSATAGSQILRHIPDRGSVSQHGVGGLSTRHCLGPHLGLSTTILTLVDCHSKVDFLGTPSLDVVCVLRNAQFRFLWNDRMNSNDQKGSRSSNFLIIFFFCE